MRKLLDFIMSTLGYHRLSSSQDAVKDFISCSSAEDFRVGAKISCQSPAECSAREGCPAYEPRETHCPCGEKLIDGFCPMTAAAQGGDSCPCGETVDSNGKCSATLLGGTDPGSNGGGL